MQPATGFVKQRSDVRRAAQVVRSIWLAGFMEDADVPVT
jgi:hypothetical protein